MVSSEFFCKLQFTGHGVCCKYSARSSQSGGLHSTEPDNAAAYDGNRIVYMYIRPLGGMEGDGKRFHHGALLKSHSSRKVIEYMFRYCNIFSHSSVFPVLITGDTQNPSVLT